MLFIHHRSATHVQQGVLEQEALGANEMHHSAWIVHAKGGVTRGRPFSVEARDKVPIESE